jgi:4-diphosphocytidyl-2-C-methyl-D-erythritol kinase
MARLVLRAPAPAKLNLYLHVTGRRDDGYHLLDSLIAFADIHDTVEADPDDGLSLALAGPFGELLRCEGENLVLRAARALADASGRPGGAAIRLVKRLPVAAGIGGGSADAAAVLRLLTRLWEISVPAEDMRRMALTLGADVPVCLGGRAAYAGGVGERLDPAPPLPRAHLVLANPLAPLSTPQVFKARTGGFGRADRFTEAPADAAALAGLIGSRANDLTAPAIACLPAIATGLTAIGRTEGCLLARMSGSGATCFGLYGSDAEARHAASALREELEGWWIVATRLRDDTADLEAEPG